MASVSASEPHLLTNQSRPFNQIIYEGSVRSQQELLIHHQAPLSSTADEPRDYRQVANAEIEPGRYQGPPRLCR